MTKKQTRKQFRWTRESYRLAYRATRIYDAYGFMYHDEPPIVRRFRELWERHPQNQDPLLQPLSWRHDLRNDEIPF